MAFLNRRQGRSVFAAGVLGELTARREAAAPDGAGQVGGETFDGVEGIAFLLQGGDRSLSSARQSAV